MTDKSTKPPQPQEMTEQPPDRPFVGKGRAGSHRKRRALSGFQKETS